MCPLPISNIHGAHGHAAYPRRLITPWNFSARIVIRKAGPAIAAGCAVVVKPAAEVPLTALVLAELAHRAGILGGVFNVITALDNTDALGEVLTTHPIV